MTLSFSQKFPDKSPTYFVEKIINGIQLNNLAHIDILNVDSKMRYSLRDKFGELAPKIHTIRADPKNRWREGIYIHFVINNRTKNRFQFAPILPVKKVQRIVIEWKECELYGKKEPFCWIDGKCICAGFDATNWRLLARNDGFESTDDFFRWFRSDFTGKLIHWTDFSY